MLLVYSTNQLLPALPLTPPDSMKNEIKKELIGLVAVIGTIWLVFALDVILPAKLTAWGVTPRTIWGLVGIPLSPFLHSGFAHLLSNTIPLAVLLVLMAGSRSETLSTVAEIAISGGTLLWLFGRNGTADAPIVHVGASGLIYGMITFLIVAGFRERRFASLAVAMVVAVLYGSTLFFGVLPLAQGVSWDGHLAGAVAGAALAYFTVGQEPRAQAELDELHM